MIKSKSRDKIDECKVVMVDGNDEVLSTLSKLRFGRYIKLMITKSLDGVVVKIDSVIKT